MKHTLTFSGNSKSDIQVTVDGETVTSPYTLTKSCTIIIKTDNGDQSQTMINGKATQGTFTYNITDEDIVYSEGDWGPTVYYDVYTINYTSNGGGQQ